MSAEGGDGFDRHIKRAEALVQTGRFAEATVEAAKAVGVRPEDADGWLHLAWALHGLGKNEEALENATKGLALSPNNEWGLRLRSSLFSRLDRYEEALADADRAVALANHLAWGHHRRAIALSNLGRDEEALEALDRTITLDPEYADAFDSYAQIYTRLGRHEEAVAAAAHAVALAPESASYLRRYAQILDRLGRLDEAIDAAYTAFKLDPSFAPGRTLLIDLVERPDRQVHLRNLAVATASMSLALLFCMFRPSFLLLLVLGFGARRAWRAWLGAEAARPPSVRPEVAAAVEQLRINLNQDGLTDPGRSAGFWFAARMLLVIALLPITAFLLKSPFLSALLVVAWITNEAWIQFKATADLDR